MRSMCTAHQEQYLVEKDDDRNEVVLGKAVKPCDGAQNPAAATVNTTAAVLIVVYGGVYSTIQYLVSGDTPCGY